MNRYVCIHGHFYQPPRENPWLEEIEPQESAYPYHNWNERITDECYAPNAASRILEANRKIKNVVNNYPKMSFNFGPTLLLWMEKYVPDTYRQILESDQESLHKFSGHGAAIAQAYNHMIMPLANERDKRTQVLWGIRDFEHRFHRKPEGLWLPETAVDIQTLEILADHNIKFTILAPHQAQSVRKIGEQDWKEVKGGTIDPRRAYRFGLPSGRSIVLFFYDGSMARDVAFGGLLNNGDLLGQRLTGVFSNDEETQLSHIATDGETYGHHHRFGDMALAYCFDKLEGEKQVSLTVYAEFLEKHPPAYEAQIFENSSWSCSHGIERWRSDCGCNSGKHPGWKQEWRAPLRNATNWLRDALIPIYEKESAGLLGDPWKVRDEYIRVILDRDAPNIEKFFEEQAGRKLSRDERIKALKLLEMQRHAMLMFTSCGWFFDDISGIETVQILQYAARALQLAKEVSGADLEAEFIGHLKPAVSNVTQWNDGAQVYDMFVRPGVVDLKRMAVHYAIHSAFMSFPQTARIYSCTIEQEAFEEYSSETKKLVIGRIKITSEITQEESTFSFAVSYLGDHNLNGGVGPSQDKDVFAKMQKELKGAFLVEDFPELNKLIGEYFPTHDFSLWNLFKGEQEKVLDQILDPTLQQLKNIFRQIFQFHFPLLQAKQNMRLSLPKAIVDTVEFVMNRDLRELLEKDYLDLNKLRELTDEVKQWSFELENLTLSFVASHRINALLQRLWEMPENIELLKKIHGAIHILSDLRLNLNLWRAENIYFLMKKFADRMIVREKDGDDFARQWLEHFRALGEQLDVKGN